MVSLLSYVCLQDDEAADGLMPVPEVIAPPKKESAWERGLKLAKEVREEFVVIFKAHFSELWPVYHCCIYYNRRRL